ncbi:MAG: gliding motility protein GldN [Bacteroidetes bacterium]|nr:MAG: gliding motility protein GldN [Bacteroidota bacterium]
MKNVIVSAVLMVASSMSFAQEVNGGPINVPSENIIDGVYIKEHIPTKRLIPYEYVREADVIWSKRVWRTIDMREKINHPIYLPLDDFSGAGSWVRHAERWSLWTVIRTHVLNGDLRIFDPENPYALGTFDGDQFKYPVVPEPGKNYYTDSLFRDQSFRLLGRLGPQSTIPLTDINGDDSMRLMPDGVTMEIVYPPRDTFWYKSKDIVQYRLKEDWFFDKERSQLDVRILGICPVVYKQDDSGNISGLLELFWLYFPHCRFVFNNYFVYNTDNDAQWMSFDDLFWKRRFSSTIYKQSNVFDRKIESYRTGVDALMESQKITEEIRNIEHDVWHF